MRLKDAHKQAIKEAIHKRDPAARIYLFGSRADDLKFAGDIDLMVLSDQIGFRDELRIRREILDAIGWQKLDLIVEKNQGHPRPIVEIARQTGIEL
jgi:predicted nucleotidyltransferase